MIYVEIAEHIQIAQAEVLRYLGMGQSVPEPHLLQEIDMVTQEVTAVLAPKACLDFSDISVENATVDFGVFSVPSKELAKHLADCRRAAFFCATVGIGVDRVIAKYTHLSPLKATVAQSVGAVAIESFCDMVCDKIREKSGLFLRPRFSPGYGDFDITHQQTLFRVLDVSKMIGVFLTDSFLMTPTKSVSAVVGLTDKNTQCIKHGCQVCTNRGTCQYARG